MHTTEILTRQLAEALADLAKDCLYPVEVAAKLLTAGCAGQPNECCTCPVAVWLTRSLTLPDGCSLIVDETEATIGSGGDGFDVMPAAVLPGVVAEFIRQFDQHPEDYPELITP